MRRCVLFLSFPTLAACLPPVGLDTASLPPGDSALDTGSGSDTGDTSDTSDTGDTSDPIDADADGSPDDEDCDDVNSGVHPGAPELFNGVDDDCDGQVSGRIDEFASVPNNPGGFFGTAVLYARGIDGGTGQEFFSGAVPSVGGAVVANTAAVREGSFDSESALFGVSTDDVSAGLGYSQLLVDLDGDAELDWVIGAPGTADGSGALYFVEDTALSLRDAIDLDETAPTSLHVLLPDSGVGSASVGGSVVQLGEITAAGATGLVGGGVWLHPTPSILASPTTVVSDGQHIDGAVGDIGLGAGLETADFSCAARPGLLVGAPLATGGATNSGKAYGFEDATLGTGADLTSEEADLEVNGGLKDAYLGGLLFNAGDVDDDGCDDWWIGSYTVEGETRTFALMLGNATADRLSVATQAHAVIDGIAQYEEFNIASSAVVDVDGDSRKDFVVGEPGKSPGEIHLFMADQLRDGGALELDAAFDFATGTTADDLFGAGVIGIDDGGGDGLMVGAPILNTIYYLPTH